MNASELQKRALLQDLHLWGPTLQADLDGRFPATLVQSLVRDGLLEKRKRNHLKIYLLAGPEKLKHYGIEIRQKYVPTEKGILTGLMLRVLAQQYRQGGYKVALHHDPASPRRAEAMLVTREHYRYMVIGRPTISFVGIRHIAKRLSLQQLDLLGIHLYVLERSDEYNLSIMKSSYGIPVLVSELDRARVLELASAGSQPSP